MQLNKQSQSVTDDISAVRLIMGQIGDTIVRFSNALNQLTVLVVGTIIGLMLIAVLYGAFFRYVLNKPLAWVLPVSRLFLVWSALLSIPIALKQGEHVAVEGLMNLLPGQWKQVSKFSVLILILIFAGTILWHGWIVTIQSRELYMISSKIQISYSWSLAAGPASAFLQIVHVLASLAKINEADEIEIDGGFAS